MKKRIIRTGLMTVIMTGLMTLLIVILNRVPYALLLISWLKKWLIAIIALYPVAYVLGPVIQGCIGRTGARGPLFRILQAAVTAVVYAFWMTFVMSAIQLGFTRQMIAVWLRLFRLLAGVAFVLLLILAPVVGKLTEKICGKNKTDSGQNSNS